MHLDNGNIRSLYGDAPIGVLATAAADVDQLCGIARDRGIASTVVSSTTAIPSGVEPLFFEWGRVLMAEIDFATHLFVVAA